MVLKQHGATPSLTTQKNNFSPKQPFFFYTFPKKKKNVTHSFEKIVIILLKKTTEKTEKIHSFKQKNGVYKNIHCRKYQNDNNTVKRSNGCNNQK